MFDVTVTSNHWVLNPGRNLGLQLALETTSGEEEVQTTTQKQMLIRLFGFIKVGAIKLVVLPGKCDVEQ